MLNIDMPYVGQYKNRTIKMFCFTTSDASYSTTACDGEPKYIRNKHIDIPRPAVLSIPRNPSPICGSLLEIPPLPFEIRIEINGFYSKERTIKKSNAP